MEKHDHEGSDAITATALNPTPEQYKKAMDEAASWKDKYMRLYAELENSKKRMAGLYAGQAEENKELIFLEILPLVDNLERALENTRVDTGNPDMRHGIVLTLKSLMDMLDRHAVLPMIAQEHPFDPALHEAIGVVSDSHMPPGTVVRVEQTGYTINDKLLRPARVIVASE